MGLRPVVANLHDRKFYLVSKKKKKKKGEKSKHHEAKPNTANVNLCGNMCEDAGQVPKVTV